MTNYWDENMGRFKDAKNSWSPVLDIQTLGAFMLKSTGDDEKALRSLSYAREVFPFSCQEGQVFGLGDMAGPWSISNEITGQYISAGGNESNKHLNGLIMQQRKDGAMPGSPHDFKGDRSWATTMHGVSPTAWLYFASSTGPFNVTESD